MLLFNKPTAVSYTNKSGDKVYPVVVDIKMGVQGGESITFVTSDRNTGVLSVAFTDKADMYSVFDYNVICTIQRPNQTSVDVRCTNIRDNIIEVPLNDYGTTMAGTYYIDFKIYKTGDKVIGTPILNYSVSESLAHGDIVEGDSPQFPQELTIRITNLIDEAERVAGELEGNIADTESLISTVTQLNTTMQHNISEGNLVVTNINKSSDVASVKKEELESTIGLADTSMNNLKLEIANMEEIRDTVDTVINESQNAIEEVHRAIAQIPSKDELKGDKGDKGDKGERGERGLQGIQGIQGERGLQGVKGDKGDRGIQGERGLPGEKGDTPSITHLEKQIDDKSKELDTKFETLASELEQSLQAPIVDSVEEMLDTNKQYVHSNTNTWWAYKSTVMPPGSVLPNVDNAIKWDTAKVVLNKRLNSSRVEVDAPGCATFYFTFNDEMKNILNTIDPVWIRMKGCSMYATSGNNTPTKVMTWGSNGSGGINATPSSQILMYEETENGISSTPYPSNYFNYNDNKTAPVTATKFGYMNTTVSDNSTNSKYYVYMDAIDGKLALSLIVNFASKTAITEADLDDVYITFNEPIVSYEEVVIKGWYDTGVEYNPNDDSSVVELNVRVNEIETRVEKLESDLPNIGGSGSNISTLPSYWKTRLDEISPKVEKLQKEYGVDAFHFMWASDIHSVPGSSPNNTTHIGSICRHMMDKHNIPFLAVSGDIMSQASHSNVETIWSEYAKLNNMFSPIKNHEFLATKGNHDGAWGAPVDGVYYLNNVGTKELFNVIYRRQTLDRNRVFGNTGTYFYVDCPGVRFYMLNTHTDGDGSKKADGSAVYNPMKHFVIGNEQLNWLANSLLTVQEGQKVIFMGHAPIKACKDGSILTGIITAYKNRTNYEGSVTVTGQYWGTDEQYTKVAVNKNFANAKGSVVGYFHGHIHKDTMTVDGEYPVISISTAGGDLRDDYLVNGTLSRVSGTPTETVIDLVTVTSDYIYFTRIGSGYDRKYNRATKEITIDYDSAYNPSTY